MIGYRPAIKQKHHSKEDRIQQVKDHLNNKQVIDSLTIDGISTLQQYESIHCLINSNIILIDVFEKLIKEFKITDLYLATLSFDMDSLHKILDLLDRKTINKVRMIRCNLYVGERAELYSYALDELTKRGQKIIGLNSHAKVYLLTNNKDKYLVLTGSQNLTKANLLEQLSISNNKELFSFYKSWFNFTFQE